MNPRYFLPSTHRERRRSHITFVEPADIAILWSPKAACTTAVTWAFLHNGLLPEALAFSPWIHRYRLRRYQKTERYLTRLGHLGRYGRHVVKIARSPFERAVSSYVHAYRHGYEDAALAARLRRPIGPGQRFSFREFVQYLEGIDLMRCNLHHRLQVTPLERHVLFGLKPHQIIRIEDGLEAALAEIEHRFGLPPTDFSNPVFRSTHHTSRVADNAPAADRRELSPRALPATAAFYDEDLTGRVARLYAEDFRRYGYDAARPA
jgi:hypothetical protein